ncbi:hypothetical protein HRH25_11620 [Flavisolibacter sp. BT320]|nr:hypothetical protein [Flavisolibacter longurius]
MKKINVFLAGLVISQLCTAQLVNNGSTITVQPGAVLFCGENLANAGGTLTNNGRVVVQGNFVNSAIYNSTTNDDSLILAGPSDVLLTAGNSSLHYLQVNKGEATDLVTLGSSVTIRSKLDYLAGSLSTDHAANPSFILSAPATAVFNFAAGREIAGKVQRTGWTNGDSRIFNSANMEVLTNGGTAPTEMTVLMLPQAFGGDPSQAEREVKRKFTFSYQGGSGFTADIRLPYGDEEINTNTETNLVPWHLNASEWNAKLTAVSRNAASNWVSATGISATQLAQEWKLADPNYTFHVTALLRGTWNGSAMNTSLQAVLPYTQPYTTIPFQYNGNETVTAIPANVVDWVLVELRKPASGLPADANAASIIGRAAGFLKSDGTIVALDGTTPLHFNISKQGPSFITVRHRNHLGVMSNVILSNAAGTFTNNFTLLANAYKNASLSSQPMTLLSGGKYGLWAGDGNRSGNIAASDITSIRNAVANGLSGYQTADVNLSGNLAASDVTLTKAMIAQGAQGSAPARTTGTSAGKVQSHVPDPVNE